MDSGSQSIWRNEVLGQNFRDGALLFLLIVIGAFMGCSESNAPSPSLSDAQVSGVDAAQPREDAVRELTDAGSTTPPETFSVGFKIATLDYSAPDGDRSLPLYFWYPTYDTEGSAPRYNGFLPSDIAIVDAEPAELGQMPLLLFSHGKRGMGAATSKFMLEHFARHGWLVVSWEHTGDTTFDAQDMALTYLHRPLDISAVLDYLYDSDANHDFQGKIDTLVVVSGHSRGGYGALAAAGASFDVNDAQESCQAAEESEFCQAYRQYPDRFESGFLDERIDGLIILASGDYSRFKQGIGAIQVPVMQWTAGADRNNPNDVDGDPIWAALQSSSIRLDLTNGGHFTFTSICSIAGPLGEANGCDDTNFELARAHALINEYALLFARGAVMQEGEALSQLQGLTTETLAEPNVVVSKRGFP